MSSSKHHYTSPIKKQKTEDPEEEKLELFIVGHATGYHVNNFEDHTIRELRLIWPIVTAKDGCAVTGFLVLNKSQAVKWKDILEPGQSYNMKGD